MTSDSTDDGTTPMNLSDANARELIEAAERGNTDGVRLDRSTARASSLFAIAVGLLVAAFLLVTVYVFPLANLFWVIASVVIYALALVAAVYVYARVRKGAPAGWGKRYSIGFAVTMVLYLGGVFIATGLGWTSPLFWIMYAALVAMPVAVFGSVRFGR